MSVIFTYCRNNCAYKLSIFFMEQRARLEEQIKQHNDKRAIIDSERDSTQGNCKKDDDSYEVTLDEDFLTALEYGMPPASGMVWFFYLV